MQRILWFLGCLLFLPATLGLPSASIADEPNQAGLIIEFGDGRVETRCISFGEEEITGADLLLTYSGLDMVIDASSGMGITVCRLEGEGCAYPSEHCFCQCMGGGECAYWNYFYREPGSSEWTYSALGAVLRKVRHGSVEAWVWGDGTTPPSFEGSFASICAAETAELAGSTEPGGSVDPGGSTEPGASTEPAATEAPTTSPEPPTAAPTARATQSPATKMPEPTETAPPAATTVPPTPTQTPEPDATGTLASYWPFGLMLLGLVAIGLFARRRGA